MQDEDDDGDDRDDAGESDSGDRPAGGNGGGAVDDDTGGVSLLGGVTRVDGLLGEGIGARLERWAADARIEAAARRRARERWLRQQAEEEATLAGVLIDLGEHGVEAMVHTRTGRAHRGRVGVVGADFVGLSPAHGPRAAGGVDGAGGVGGVGGEEVLVTLDSVTSVRMQAGARLVTGDRPLTSKLSLAEVITGLAAERERVVLVLADAGESLAGTLHSVGQDMVVVRLADGAPGPRPPTAYVAMATIVEVVV